MVTVQQIRQGLLEYIDSEIVNKIGGLQKWGVAFASVALVDSYINQIGILKQIGMMTEDNMVDIDAVYSRALDIARDKGNVTQHFPIVGDVTFSEKDIVKLYGLIKR